MRRKSGRRKPSPNVPSERKRPQHWRFILSVRVIFTLLCPFSNQASRSVSKEEVAQLSRQRISMIYFHFQGIIQSHTISPDGYDVGR